MGCFVHILPKCNPISFFDPEIIFPVKRKQPLMPFQSLNFSLWLLFRLWSLAPIVLEFQSEGQQQKLMTRFLNLHRQSVGYILAFDFILSSSNDAWKNAATPLTADLQLFTKYLRLTQVFMQNSGLRETFNFVFSRVFC